MVDNTGKGKEFTLIISLDQMKSFSLNSEKAVMLCLIQSIWDNELHGISQSLNQTRPAKNELNPITFYSYISTFICYALSSIRLVCFKAVLERFYLTFYGSIPLDVLKKEEMVLTLLR